MIAALILVGLLIAAFVFGQAVGRSDADFDRDVQDLDDRLDRIDFEIERRFKL